MKGKDPHNQIFERRPVPIGQVIFREGQQGTKMYIVESGEVQIYKETPRGERELGIVRDGGIFGEMALIDDSPRMASARAQDNCVLQVVEREKLNKKLEKADPFLRALLKILVQNLRAMSKQIT